MQKIEDCRTVTDFMNYIKNQDEKIKQYEACISDVVPKNQYNAMKAQYDAKIEMLENKLAGHEEFKKNAENVCESYAVTESLMKQIEERDTELGHNKTEIKGMEKAFEDIAEELEIDKDHKWFGHFGESIDKIRKLDEERLYWKNFALVYWSGNQLGEDDCSGCDVWQECLDTCNDTPGLDAVDFEELTKMCMDTPY
jgi:predicted RNase H-like nuclease (RuvC/YqgF family)